MTTVEVAPPAAVLAAEPAIIHAPDVVAGADPGSKAATRTRLPGTTAWPAKAVAGWTP